MTRPEQLFQFEGVGADDKTLKNGHGFDPRPSPYLWLMLSAQRDPTLPRRAAIVRQSVTVSFLIEMSLVEWVVPNHILTNTVWCLISGDTVIDRLKSGCSNHCYKQYILWLVREMQVRELVTSSYQHHDVLVP